MLRNLVLLLMALNSTNFIRTAEAMVHYCKQILALSLSTSYSMGYL